MFSPPADLVVDNKLPPLLARDLTPPVTDALAPTHASSPSSCPPLTFGHTPLSAAFRHISPTWRNYVMYVDLEARGGNEDARRFISVWLALPSREQRSAMPEQICELAAVAPHDLVAMVSRQAWLEGSSKASLAMSFLKDRVIDSTAAFAMAAPENYKHVELFMKAAGMLPVAQGRSTSSPNVTVPFQVNFGAGAGTNGTLSPGQPQLAAPSAPGGVLSMDDEIRGLSKALQDPALDTVACAAEKVREIIDPEDDADADADNDDDDDDEHDR